ncbi:hypothetical protein E4U45_005425 [Claviceps purpurea]|nr:hypothetical protein E4U45_005425 [Claviceps purpurea]
MAIANEEVPIEAPALASLKDESCSSEISQEGHAACSHVTICWICHESLGGRTVARDDIPEDSTTIDIDKKIAYLYSFYVEQAKTFERLRRTFYEDFEYWTLQMWEKASYRTRQEMRDLLQDNGIDVGNASGRNMIASELHHVVMRCIHGDSQQQEEPQKPDNELPFNERVDLVTEDSNSHPAVEANQPLHCPVPNLSTTVNRRRLSTQRLSLRLHNSPQLATRKLKEEESSVDFMNKDPSVDLCEGSGSNDTFPDDNPVKQKGKEEETAETLPEGFAPCEQTHSQENLELSPLNF